MRSMVPVADESWANVIPETLCTHSLEVREETIASARQLLHRGAIDAEDFIEQSPDVERTLLESFIEDDFERLLHLTTLVSTEDEEVVGISFWREVEANEMEDWLDLGRVERAIKNRRLLDDTAEHDDELPPQARQKLRLVRSSSARWIDALISPCAQSTQSTAQKLTHSWIKIELIAIKKNFRSLHLGAFLLGCTLAKAHDKCQDHVVLHVAGGKSKNVAAAKLYSRFGFIAIPRHSEGGPFARPDKDVFVLGDIGSALHDVPWRAALG
ncbi:hypothetical protein THAOC_37890 [Thalassiosira oceanica]|uniref:N-acetyltransferase domain-containing protein n=1 Tax=Thalassiosira oceanica TaxID=159749 RepID=K0R559_THAOC|nr:hypothetical protein THAOC_37890 [Thalassiosira oceanica]|mmetsp:Transcript_10464/g.24403  ORF Transcript_10464/g.24403 Transcript_10464/m.24403 type:complete len:270 (+) Transcript_10464:42-851(+)|eukprot:EJK43646.1 hypothetical protein THAOC_37890 [Thalassiosira oceanica]